MNKINKIMAFSLGTNEDALLDEEKKMSDEEFARYMGIDPRVIAAISASEAAFNAYYPNGGKQGIKKWREQNPELASLLDDLSNR